MKVSVVFDPNDVRKFRNDIDTLFHDIRYEVSSPKNYESAVEKTRKGMRENKLALKNSSGWEKVKDKLKSDGRIDFKEPLNVTGQLVNDFYANIYATSPKDLEKIGVELTFKDTPRLRPTLKSMYGAYLDTDVQIEYEMSSSLQIARKLEKYTGTLNGVNYNITDAIYKLYSQDYEKVVFAAVSRAFTKNK